MWTINAEHLNEDGNSTVKNVTTTDEAFALLVASYSNNCLENVQIFCIPMMLGFLVNNLTQTSIITGCSHKLSIQSLLFIASGSQLANHSLNILTLYQTGYVSNIWFGICFGVYYVIFTFLRISSLLLAGSLMINLSTRCLAADENAIVFQVQSYLENYKIHSW
jgi:hypothetical protein